MSSSLAQSMSDHLIVYMDSGQGKKGCSCTEPLVWNSEISDRNWDTLYAFQGILPKSVWITLIHFHICVIQSNILEATVTYIKLSDFFFVCYTVIIYRHLFLILNKDVFVGDVD